MTWIEKVGPEDATGALADFYRSLGSARGGVAEVHQVQSLNPRAMKAHLELYKAVVFARSSLSRIQRERIAVAVSSENACPYCVGHHSAALRELGDDEAIVVALEGGEVPEALSEADGLLLTWAKRSTRLPADATEADVVALREAGFDDKAILDATLTLSYFNFVNRLVLLLGVHLEEGYEATCKDEEV